MEQTKLKGFYKIPKTHTNCTYLSKYPSPIFSFICHIVYRLSIHSIYLLLEMSKQGKFVGHLCVSKYCCTWPLKCTLSSILFISMLHVYIWLTAIVSCQPWLQEPAVCFLSHPLVFCQWFLRHNQSMMVQQLMDYSQSFPDPLKT